METMMVNVIEEINDSRTDMFEILENFAMEKQKGKKSKIEKKKSQRINKNVNNTFNYNSRSITGASNKPFSDLEDIIDRSNSKAQNEVEDKGGLLIFEDMDNSNFEEEKNASANSPRSSSGSSFNNTLENDNADAEEDEDEFEDAQDEELLPVDSSQQMQVLSNEIITDCDQERISLPFLRDHRIKASTIWNLLKDMVGKDLTKFSLPVILCEPLSSLQKYSEPLCFNYLLQKAVQ